MLLTFNEYCDRAMIFMFARADFKKFVEAKGMEMKQTSTTWRQLWNEFKR